MSPETELQTQGFAVLRALAAPDVVGSLQAAYDELLAGGASGDRLLGGLTRQVMLPEQDHDVFDDNAALAAGMAFAVQACGWQQPRRTFSMLIFKPGGHPHETPWHQDISYLKQPATPEGYPVRRLTLQFWVALDEVSPANGAMHFLDHPFDVALAHRVAAGDPIDEGRLLGLVDESIVSPERVVTFDLAPGDSTVHHEGVLHYTTPNLSTRPRRAYIFNLQDAAA